MLWKVMVAGQIHGPFEADFIIYEVQKGAMPLTTLVAQPGYPWVGLHEVEPFRSALYPPTPLPQPVSTGSSLLRALVVEVERRNQLVNHGLGERVFRG